jgi:hypothetical protein
MSLVKLSPASGPMAAELAAALVSHIKASGLLHARSEAESLRSTAPASGSG